MEEWIGKLRELEAKEEESRPRASGARERSPLKRREENREKHAHPSEPKESKPSREEATPSEKPRPSVPAPPKAPPVPPKFRERGGERVTSQCLVPKALGDKPPEVEESREAVANSPGRESKETPKAKKQKKEKSPSS